MTNRIIKPVFNLLSIILVLFVLATASVPEIGVAASQDLQLPDRTKIEPVLLERLAADTQADFIVIFTDQADLSAAYAMDWKTRGEFVVNTLTKTSRASQAFAKLYLDQRGLTYQTYIASNSMYVWGGDLLTVDSLSALPEVNFIRATRVYWLDPIIQPAFSFSDSRWAGDLVANGVFYTVPLPLKNKTLATVAWGITDAKADQFWSTYGYKGDGIVVANIDTGVQWNHPALINQFKCGNNPSDPTCWKDPANICGSAGACDNNGHGTHTMGTMIAADNPALTYIAGMAPNARWIACKGCESNSCSDASLNACADWILAPGGDSANRPHIVNNSWGGGGGDSWYLTKVNAWRAAGIFPAFSAGNSGPSCSTIGSPGDYQESFASAAHASNRTIASFSSRGPSVFGHTPYTKPNLSAPGVSICSTIPTNAWSCGYSGTSMASPHTAGAVALLWSCNPSLIGQIDQTFQLLQNSVDAPPPGSCSAPPDGQGNYTYGYGFLNVLKAGQLTCSISTRTPTPPSTQTSTPTPTAISTQTPTATSTKTPTPSSTSTSTNTPTITQTPTSTATITQTPTSTSTNTQTSTITQTPTSTATITLTHTTTSTSTGTNTPTITLTHSATSTSTSTPIITLTPTSTSTATDTPTITLTHTATSTPTHTQTITPSPSLTKTPTITITYTLTPTSSRTPTPSTTITITQTITRTATPTASQTPTPTKTQTPTPTCTLSPTVTPTLTPTLPSYQKIYIPLILR